MVGGRKSTTKGAIKKRAQLERPAQQESTQTGEEMASKPSPDDEWSGPLTKRDIGMLNKNILALKDDLTGLLRTELATLREELHSDLTQLKESVTSAESRLDRVEESQAQATASALESGKELKELQMTVSSLELKCEELENRSRRGNIRLKNLAEGAEGEDLGACMKELLKTMGCNEIVEDIHFDLIHRVWAPWANKGNRPRDILFKTHEFKHKEMILQAARKQENWDFLNSKVSLFQDMAPATLARRRDWRPITEMLRKHDVKYKWLHPFGLNFDRYNIHTFEEGREAVKSLLKVDVEICPQNEWGQGGARGRTFRRRDGSRQRWQPVSPNRVNQE